MLWIPKSTNGCLAKTFSLRNHSTCGRILNFPFRLTSLDKFEIKIDLVTNKKLFCSHVFHECLRRVIHVFCQKRQSVVSVSETLSQMCISHREQNDNISLEIRIMEIVLTEMLFSWNCIMQITQCACLLTQFVVALNPPLLIISLSNHPRYKFWL